MAEFVPLRNALASELKKAGEAEAAAELKALKKPGASAWAVNQLFWRHRDRFEAILAAGDAYRAAQKEALAGGEAHALQDAERDRREAIDEGQRLAERLLADDGGAASATVVSRIATTLEALASYGHASPTPYDGCASGDLEPPGFAALAALAPATPPKPSASKPPVSNAAEETERSESSTPTPSGEEEARREARREIDSAIASAEKELDRLREAIALMERELQSVQSKRAELTKLREALKERRRELD